MTLAAHSFHEEIDLKGLDLREGRLEDVELLGCTVSDSDLGEATLDRCSFEDVVFKRCDLGVVKLGGSAFRGVRFEDCKLTGIDWSRAHDLTFEVTFVNCVLDFSAFVGLKLKGLRATGGKAHHVVFADSDMRKVTLKDMDLAGTTFTGNDLRDADFSTCTNLELEPNTNRLQRTKLPLDAALRHLSMLGIKVPGLGG